MAEMRAVSHDGGKPVTFGLGPLREFDPGTVEVEPLEPVDSRFGRFGGRCLVLRHVLSPEECGYLIQEMSGDMVEVSYGRTDYRRNDRCIVESTELAEVLWRRVRPAVERLVVCVDPSDAARQRLLAEEEGGDCPAELRVGYGSEGVWRPAGLNECLRFCRYNPGGFFRAHCDGVFRRSEDEMSLFTCMFYLDGAMEGGATRFLHLDGEQRLGPAPDDEVLASVAPEPGLCLLFFQPGLLHEGEDLRAGVKHILRTDVMYCRDPATKPLLSPQQAEALDLVQQAEVAERAKECDKAMRLYRRAFKLDPRLERMY